MKAFEWYHPIILFVYFIAMIFITMFTQHPVLLGISFVCAVSFCGMLTGLKKLLKSLAYSIPVLLVIAVTNPLFSHNGETVLFFLNDNPVTLEAILYGLDIAVMIMAVFYWFKCYHAVMTSDKFIYLFGRVIPKLSLLLSMVLNFIPKFKRQYKEIDQSQKALGIYGAKGYIDKIRSRIRVLSILVTWSLENSVETADSMRARGYGLKGRTSYSIFKWTVRDTVMAALVFAFTAMICFLMSLGYAEYWFYPTFKAFDRSVLAILLYVGLFVLMMLSTATEIKENIAWRYLRSKI
ncbi:MAG TPA: energy-coupling factor transporter transmembrane protein EcfT [Candidatus Borkfalkia excrementigallinarum]|uniref:Energy-coupling factor transporter transmembrane protein EcfT n=1 Tax=Candidatus Borkfalkia excrementigallinarum TaxID=2838506 RepID=A0A9D1ZY64_9FIRM|nr:energy-coupling factor transporter transmembrane protein EcfT [Candidatus Borkfalkia excrementigallinarum]